MIPGRALLLVLVTGLLVGACAPAAPMEAGAGLAARARRAAGPLTDAAATAPREPDLAPAFPGDVLTDVRDVRACLPLDDGAVLAGTGGGLLLVRADGTARAPWTALDGLPETRVHALLREGERIWIGTEGGLAAAHLHGAELAIDRTIPGKPVRALARHDGALFVATWGDGIARVDEDRGRLEPRRAPARSRDDRFSALAEHEGALFAASPSGLYRVTDDDLAPVAGAPASIWALAAHEGRLWIGGLTGLASLDHGVLRPAGDADVRALAPAGEVLLAGTFGQGALAIRGGHGRAIAELGAAPFVTAVAAAGAVQCAGGPDGLFVQRGADAPFRAVRVPDLPSNDVSAIARDGDRLWIGTFDRGLAVLEGGRAVRVRDPGLDDKINALAVERTAGGSRVWVATARGLDLVEPQGEGFAGVGDVAQRPAGVTPSEALGFGAARGPIVKRGFRVTRYDELSGLPSSDVHAVVALSTGGALVGTARGAAVVEGGRVTALVEKRGLVSGAVWTVAEGPGSLLLLGTSRGLLVGDLDRRGVVFHRAPVDESPGAPRPWVQLTISTSDLADDWITAIAVHGRTIYVGTYNAGVTRLDLGEDGRFTPEQLGGGYVNPGGLLVHGGALFAATMNGLLVRPADGSGAWRTAQGAAPGKDVTAVAPDGGRVWVASRRGLARFAPPRPRGDAGRVARRP